MIENDMRIKIQQAGNDIITLNSINYFLKLSFCANKNDVIKKFIIKAEFFLFKIICNFLLEISMSIK